VDRSAVITPDVESVKSAEVAAPRSAGGPRSDNSGAWLSRHTEALAATILAAAFGLRIYVAAGSYLNPDEALHYALIHQRSLLLAYKASLTNAHPPLIYVILYFWQFLGHSELMLRLPSVLAGTAFCWILCKWVSMLFGRAAGLSAIVLAAFSPSLISLSAQVRAYAVMLFCMAGALFFLERALREKSAGEMWRFTAFLYLSILSHYSAVFFAFALGVYALARIVESRPERKVVAAWIAGQAGALAIYAFLYLTHISRIKPSEMDMWANPHENAFFHAGQDSLLAFTLRKSGAIFRFLFLENYIYWGLLALFACAVVLLLFGVLRPQGKPAARSWPLGLLFLLPFVAEWAASLFHIYPYTGSRQSALVAPFVFAGLSALFAKLSEEKIWPPLVIAGLIALAGQTSPVRFEPYFGSLNSAPFQMASAAKYIREAAPRTEPILVDMQSGFLLRYYLCDPADEYLPAETGSQFAQFQCGGYSAISTDDHTWKFTPGNFVERFEQAAATYKFKPGDRVWVFQSGWGANLDTELPWYVVQYRCLVSKSFGASITVIPFVVGPDLSPGLPAGSPHLSRLGQCVP
jgi:4-amino-4-deoxy-L-arabinose transferase-like glycosyltransferase